MLYFRLNAVFFLQIRQKILSALPPKDLRSCAAVCRYWQQEARAVSSTRKQCAYVKDCCADILNFVDCLRLSRPCAFTGLVVRVKQRHFCQTQTGNKSTLDVFDARVKELNLSSMVLHIAPCMQGKFLISRLILKARHSVQELSLIYAVIANFRSNPYSLKNPCKF